MPFYNITFPYCGGSLHRHLIDFYKYLLDQYQIVENLQTLPSIVVKTQFEMGFHLFQSLIDQLCRVLRTVKEPSEWCGASHDKSTFQGLFALLKCLWVTLDIDNLEIPNHDVRWTKIANLLINLYTVFYDIENGSEIEDE